MSARSTIVLYHSAKSSAREGNFCSGIDSFLQIGFVENEGRYRPSSSVFSQYGHHTAGGIDKRQQSPIAFRNISIGPGQEILDCAAPERADEHQRLAFDLARLYQAPRQRHFGQRANTAAERHRRIA